VDTCRRRRRTQNGHDSELERVRRTEISETHVQALPASATVAKRPHDVVDLTGGGKLPAHVSNDVIDLVDSDEEGHQPTTKVNAHHVAKARQSDLFRYGAAKQVDISDDSDSSGDEREKKKQAGGGSAQGFAVGQSCGIQGSGWHHGPAC
jgi:hypothetical protein